MVGLDRMAPPDPSSAPLVHRRPAQLRREPAALSRRSRGAGVLERAGPAAGAQLSRAEPAGRRRGGGAAARTGFAAGDRVAGFLPNLPETVIAMLGHRQPGRHLVFLLARLRRQRRARPLRPDPAQGPLLRRWLSLCREGNRLARPGARSARADSRDPAGGGGAVSASRSRNLGLRERELVGRLR